ncbi:MAG: undecaprenyl-phosphate glucose phosphotransferase [Kiloniellales bacterium]
MTAVSMLLRVFDAGVILLAGYASYLLYERLKGIDSEFHYVEPTLTGTLVAIVVFHSAGIYQESDLLKNIRRIDRVLIAWLITVGILLTIGFASQVTAEYSRFWAGTWVTGVMVLLPVGRLLVGGVTEKLAAEGRFARRAAIVGAGQNGERLAKHLKTFGAPYFQIVGFFDDRKDRVPNEISGYSLLGDTAYLIKCIEAHQVDVIIIALPWRAEQRLLRLIEQLATKPVELRLAPDLIGFNFLDRSTTNDARLPMLHLFDRPLSGWSYAVKAVEDWVISLFVLLFVGPLMLLIALAIKLDSPGPVLFRQGRYGFNDKTFDVFKFRTMRADVGAQDGSRQASRDDPRITRVGRFLRKSSLDELPQVLNVLKGDMSIVGPRPHPTGLRASGRRLEEVVDRYAARHRVKPGITGWAQVNGWRGETETVEKIRQRVEHDLYYIDNWSVWLDLRIILKTLWIVWDDNNAY